MGAQAQNALVDPKKLKDLILEDVRQQGLDRSPEVQAAVQTAREAVLVKVWEQTALKAKPVTQEQKEAAYKELLALLGTSEYRILHLVVKNEDHAKAIVERMRTNVAWDQIDFKSIVNSDPSLKAQKTDWVNMTMLLPEFRPVVKDLKVGEVHASPLKAQDVWHVVGLLDARPLAAPTYDQIKLNVEKLAEQKVIGEKIKSILGKK